MKNKSGKFAIFCLFFVFISKCLAENCSEWTRKHVFNNTEFHSIKRAYFYLIIFNDFAELTNPSCNENTTKKKNAMELKFYPASSILFENDFSLQIIINMFQFRKFREKSTIRFLNMKGFNQNAYHINSITNNVRTDSFYFIFSNTYFDFYLNKSHISSQMCVRRNFLHKNYFWPMSSIIFEQNVFYSPRTCPYVFLNSQLTDLIFLKIVNSFIFKNQLGFSDINETESAGVCIENLVNLGLEIIFEDLTLRLMNKYLFKSVQILSVSGSIRSIQADLFDHFRELKIILINTDNIGQFYRNGLEWLTHLNRDLRVDLANGFSSQDSLRVKIVKFRENISPFRSVYSYPDADLCLFKNFPHRQLVLPMILNGGKGDDENNFECTCTIIWLIRYSALNLNASYKQLKHFLANYLSNENASVIHCLQLDSEHCHFDEKLANCVDGDTLANLKYLNGVYTDSFAFKYLEMIIELLLRPFLSVLGVITSFLSLIIIKNRAFQHDFKNDMYTNILFNSLFNFLFCLLNSFALVNVCIFARTSFCSSTHKSLPSQYFKIYVTSFLANAVRTCCNTSYLLFSLSRFSIISSSRSTLLHRLQTSNKLKFYITLFLLSLIWSVFKIFELQPNELHALFEVDFPYYAFDAKYCLVKELTSNAFQFWCSTFSILNLINNVFNNVLFIVLSIVVDVLLYRFSRKYVEEKMKMFHDQKQKDEALEHQKKINRLIFTNVVLYFVSHLPEFITTILVISFKHKLEHFSLYFFTNSKLIELAEAFSLLSISLQFFVLNQFDRHFQASFKQIKDRFKHKYLYFYRPTTDNTEMLALRTRL